jgi:hypothetical protein
MIIYSNKKVDTPQVYLIGFYPYPETNADNQWSIDYHFKSLVHTYGLNCQVLYEPDELVELPDFPIISLEEPNNGTVDLNTFTHPRDAIYIVGNSLYEKPSDYFPADHRVHINAPGSNQPLYGDQAAAIALHDRYQKSNA